MQLVDCSYSNLGHLVPLDFIEKNQVSAAAGCHVINGVPIPEHVMEELRILGLPLAAYNAGELQDAVQACHYDRKLVDDHHGHHFRDQLTLTHEEKLKRSRKDGAHQDEEHNCLFW